MVGVGRTIRILVVWGLSAAAMPLYGDGPSGKVPSFAAVEAVVRRHFSAQAERHPKDILARSEVETALRQVEKAGWKVPRREEILRKVHDDQDFLVQSLRTPAGVKFMRQIAGYAMGYDRLDRLAEMPHGRPMVQDMVRGPDGYKMVEYMTRAPGGKEMGRMLNRAVNGAGFNQPTGRIYTVDTLVVELKRTYDATVPAPSGKR